MTITAAQFRADLTVFADSTDYPDSDINYWLNAAYLILDPGIWGALLDLVVEQFVAHNLSLELMAKREAANGNQPGVARGMLSGGGVDKVNYSYDTNSIKEEDGSFWNSTIYGLRFLNLQKQMCRVPVFVGVDYDPSNSAIAWAGPYPMGGVF